MPMTRLGLGLHVGTSIGGFTTWPNQATSNAGIIDAVGESTAFIGRILLHTGPGTSITMGATSKIIFKTGTSTFSNAGSTFRIGIQDVAATGLEDGTFDVYRDVVGGSGLLPANSLVSLALSTAGSKTIAHGDVIAVVAELTARGGADAVQAFSYGSGNLTTLPYITRDTGAGPVRQANMPMVSLIDNNGIAAAFDECAIPAVVNNLAFNSGSTPDEYVLALTLPFGGICDRLVGHISEVDTGETGEFHLYHDPFSANLSVLATGTHDGDLFGAVAALSDGALAMRNIEPVRLYPGVTYGVAYRPTSATNRTLHRRQISEVAQLDCAWLGRSLCGGSRTNQTGAFDRETTQLPSLGLVMSHIDIPAHSPRTRVLRSL